MLRTEGIKYEQNWKVSTSTWEKSIVAESKEYNSMVCSLKCHNSNKLCNSFHFDKESNTCVLANIKFMEDIQEEESMLVYIKSDACLDKSQTAFLVGGGTYNTAQSYPFELPLPTGFSAFRQGGVALLNGIIYIYNSYTHQCFSNVGGNWELLTKCVNQQRQYASMTTVGNYIMIFGGSFKSTYLNTIERFNGNTWTILANNLTYGRDAHCSVAISSTEVLVIGGKHVLTSKTTMEKYDINGYHIETLPSMELARSSSGCAVYNNEVYVSGGVFLTYSSGMSSVEVYNILAKQWRTANNMKRVRWGHDMHVFNGKLRVFGGGDAVAQISMEEFDGIHWIEDNTNLSKPFYRGGSIVIPLN